MTRWQLLEQVTCGVFVTYGTTVEAKTWGDAVTVLFADDIAASNVIQSAEHLNELGGPWTGHTNIRTHHGVYRVVALAGDAPDLDRHTQVALDYLRSEGVIQ